MEKIVVGVDGSPESEAALCFALAEARAHGAAVQAISAWHVPTMAFSGGIAPPLGDLAADLEEAAGASLDQAVAGLGPDASEIAIEKSVREGQPAEVLIDEAGDADLLVVGSRGRGGFGGLLLGSVSQQCAHHAPCPITIVRRPGQP